METYCKTPLSDRLALLFYLLPEGKDVRDVKKVSGFFIKINQTWK